MKKLIILIPLLILFSCKKESFPYSKTDILENYPDGNYCAEINYYNPKTGTSSTYILPVEVENGELIKILWPNGGWLDDSHFIPPDISEGEANFTSDVGYEYVVKLQYEGDCNYPETPNYSKPSHKEEDLYNNNENSYFHEEKEPNINSDEEEVTDEEF